MATPTTRNVWHFAKPGTHYINGTPGPGDTVRTRYNVFTLGDTLHPTQLDAPEQRKHQGHLFRLLNVRVSDDEVDLFDVLCLTCDEDTHCTLDPKVYGLAYDVIAARHTMFDGDTDRSVREEVAAAATDAGWFRMQTATVDVYYQRQLKSQRPVVLEWNGAEPVAVWLDGVRRGDVPQEFPHGLVYGMCFVFDMSLAREGGAV
jgi:hypothetical protein